MEGMEGGKGEALDWEEEDGFSDGIGAVEKGVGCVVDVEGVDGDGILGARPNGGCGEGFVVAEEGCGEGTLAAAEDGRGDGAFDTEEGRGDGFVTVDGCGDATAAGLLVEEAEEAGANDGAPPPTRPLPLPSPSKEKTDGTFPAPPPENGPADWRAEFRREPL